MTDFRRRVTNESEICKLFIKQTTYGSRGRTRTVRPDSDASVAAAVVSQHAKGMKNHETGSIGRDRKHRARTICAAITRCSVKRVAR